MGCNSDYMNPTDKERALQETAQLYVWVHQKIKPHDPVPVSAAEAAAEPYCKTDFVPWLCKMLTYLKHSNPAEFDRLVYDAHDPMSRRLADWWETHEAADKARLEAEKLRAEAERRDIIIDRLKKLSPKQFAELEAWLDAKSETNVR